MLVVSRKKNESIVIGGDITVTVIEVRDDRVRLGVDAPRGNTVHRKEVVLGGRHFETFRGLLAGSRHDETTRLPGIREIETLVETKIAEKGGRFHGFDRRRGNYFIRSLVPGEEEVGRNDSIQSGVAVKIEPPSVVVCHYTLRRVCTNGMMMRTYGFAREIQMVESSADDYTVKRVLAEISEAIDECASPEHRTLVARRMRAARAMSIEDSPRVEALRDRLRVFTGDGLFRNIMRRFRQDRDSSLFGLVNAVTATARDTEDPVLKWQLEELGGEILSLVSVSDPTERLSEKASMREFAAA